MSAAENVYSLPINSVYKDITTFLRDQDSVHTMKNYERAIRYFFSYMLQGKRLEDLTVEDLKFRYSDVKEYRLHLKDKFASAGTANLYLAAVISLYNFLKRDYDVNADAVKVDFLNYNPQSYGKLTIQEAETMAELAKQELNGQEKSALIRLAYTTSFRKEALLSLKWSDFKKDTNKPVYWVTTVDKGEKKHSRPITEELYAELLKITEIKRYKKKNYTDNNVFHISNDTIQNMMNALKEKMGFKPEDNIVFHSLRSVLPNYAANTLKDLKMAKEQANHSDINTTIKGYTEKYDDPESMPGVMIEQKISDDVFDALSRDEMLALLKSQTNGTLLALKMGAKKMLQEKMKVEVDNENEKESIG